VNSAVLPSNLPSVARAKLPEVYESARTALQHCSKVDQCKEWADQAEALASYAKQAGDDSMRKMCDRIQARAIRRCGELLEKLQPKDSPGRPKKGNGAVTISRKKAAEDAGLSTRQKRTALRVSKLPADEFEEAVESADPPTVTDLAERGTKKKPKPLMDLEGRDPKEFALATTAQGEVMSFGAMAASSDAGAVARGLFDRERRAVLKEVPAIKAWLDRLVKAIEKEIR